MTIFYRSVPLPKFYLFVTSFSLVAVLMLFLGHLFEPHWYTNDDVGMAMIAHGYGIAKIGSPNILYSNILWGYLIRAIPEIHGLVGYSIVTLGVIALFGTILFYGLCRMGVGYFTSLLIFLLIFIPPFLFPQFTINAGLLMVSSILCLQLYARENNWQMLVMGCVLAFCSYLIRSQEFWLVLIIGLPLLSWSELLSRRATKIAFFFLSLAIVISAIANYTAYQGEEWHNYNTLNPVRASFTDFGAGTHLKKHSDILSKYGYSNNDIDLITNWFFVDSSIANPQKIKTMLAELGPLPSQAGSLISAWAGVETLWHPKILISVFTALLLFIFRPKWQIMLSWGLCIAAAFVFGLIGRPGALHVFLPVISLLLIAPFLNGHLLDWRHYITITLLFIAVFFNTTNIFSVSKVNEMEAKQIRTALAHFPSTTVVIWGGLLPYEWIYPVLGAPSSFMSSQYYALGTATLAPFGVAYAEAKIGRSMIDLLLSEEGINIIGSPAHFSMLAIYCEEHFHGKLNQFYSKQYGSLSLSHFKCELRT